MRESQRVHLLDEPKISKRTENLCRISSHCGNVNLHRFTHDLFRNGRFDDGPQSCEIFEHWARKPDCGKHVSPKDNEFPAVPKLFHSVTAYIWLIYFSSISKRAYALMKNHYALNRGASTFLNEFGHEDVFVAKMPSISLTEWSAFESRDVIADKLRKGCGNSSSRVIFFDDLNFCVSGYNSSYH